MYMQVLHSHSLLVCGMLGLVIRKGQKKQKKKVVMRMIACLVVVDPKREQVIDDRSVVSVVGVVRVVEERSEMLRNIGGVETNVKPKTQLEGDQINAAKVIIESNVDHNLAKVLTMPMIPGTHQAYPHSYAAG